MIKSFHLPPLSSGPGRGPLKAKAPVRIWLGALFILSRPLQYPQLHYTAFFAVKCRGYRCQSTGSYSSSMINLVGGTFYLSHPLQYPQLHYTAFFAGKCRGYRCQSIGSYSSSMINLVGGTFYLTYSLQNPKVYYVALPIVDLCFSTG